jgi:hypothetical protein
MGVEKEDAVTGLLGTDPGLGQQADTSRLATVNLRTMGWTRAMKTLTDYNGIRILV